MPELTGITEYVLSDEQIANIEKECGHTCQGIKGSFEVGLHRPALWGRIWGHISEKGLPPANIIRADKEWEISLCWNLYGNLVPFFCGEWCVKFHFESIGKGEEFDLPKGCASRIPLDPCKCHYEYRYPVPPGTVKPENCGTPYKIVASVQLFTNCHDHKDLPGPVTGFVEFPLTEFYVSAVS